MNIPLASSIALFTCSVSSLLMANEIPVRFQSQGTALTGTLFLPENIKEGQRPPVVIISGAWTTVKEQMPATYAKAMSEQGVAALIFDFRGWGQSEGELKYLEDPTRKTEDLLAAAEFLAARKDIDPNQIHGLGICASAGYMVDAGISSPHIDRVALVAPWLHDAAIVEQVYGGKDGVAQLLKLGKEAQQADAPQYLEAASTTNRTALMFQAPYYTESDRGAIPEYDNKFNVASWTGWLRYDAIQSASKLDSDVLIVHSEAAAIPHGAKEFSQKAGEKVKALWLENVSQFDFYDQPGPVSAAAQAISTFLHAPSPEDPSTDEAELRLMMGNVGTLADRGEFETLESLYAENVFVDYSSLNGVEAGLKKNVELMTEWASILPGFDRTHHRISSIEVNIEGEKATGTATVVADHVVGDQSWQVTGDYQYTFRKSDEGWKISHHTFIFRSETGTRDVFAAAAKQAEKDPSPYLKRD